MTTNTPKGWAKLPRRIIAETWYKDTYTARIYTHILLSSSISDEKFITSTAQLAEEMRLSTKQVRRALFLLTSGDYISTQTSAKGTIISIVGQTKGQTETPTTTAIQPNEGQTEGQTNGRLLNNIKDTKNKYVVCNITDANIIQHITNYFKYKNYINPLEETKKFIQYNIGRGNTQINIQQCEKNLDLWHQRNTRAQATNAPKYTYNEYLKIYGNTDGACWVDAIGAKNGGRLMRVCDAQANGIEILKVCGQ